MLYVCDFNAHGGTQTHLLHLLAGLDRSRFEPFLVTLTLHPDLARRLAAIDAPLLDLELKGALRVSTLRAILSLCSHARRHADLVHGFLYAGNILAAVASTASGVPCVSSVRNMDLWKRSRHRLASALAHKRSRGVVFNSALVRDATLAAEGIPPDRAVVIYNGVSDPGVTRTAPMRDRNGSGPVIVCVASLRPKKGHRYLLEAFRQVLSALPAARLWLVGEGPLHAEIDASIRDTGLGHAVDLFGYREDAIDLMRESDLFVLSSLEEGMPNALLESMSVGRPAVVTRVGGNAEVVLDGETGYLVPPADAAALADRLALLLADDDRRRRMGEAARRRFESRFTLPVMIDAYHRLYDQVLQRNGSTR